MIQKVEWDSQHFNMNVGSCNVPTQNNNCDLESLQQEAKACRYDVVYIRSECPIIGLENRQTFRDERLVYAKDRTKQIAPYGLRISINTISA